MNSLGASAPQKCGKAGDGPAKGCQGGQWPRAPDPVTDVEETGLAQSVRGGEGQN